MSTWIFLRGLTRESRHWGCFPEIFRSAIPDAQVHAPDLPGNGSLHRQQSPQCVEAMVESFRSQLAERGVAAPYHLLAMSLGAMVAVAWAARYPEEIRGCVLINTSLRPFSPFHQRLRPGNYPRLLKLALFGGSEHEWERTILSLTSRQAEAPADLLETWVGYRREYPVSTRNALRQLRAAALYRAPHARPQAPTLILTSRLDALVDTACSQQLAQQWKTGLAEHPTAGHDLPLDDGPWVARQVSQWLQTQAAQQP